MGGRGRQPQPELQPELQPVPQPEPQPQPGRIQGRWPEPQPEQPWVWLHPEPQPEQFFFEQATSILLSCGEHGLPRGSAVSYDGARARVPAGATGRGFTIRPACATIEGR